MLLICSLHSVNVPVVLVLGWPVTKTSYSRLINSFCLSYSMLILLWLLSVVINILYKNLHISCPLPYTHPYASSPDFFFYNLLAFFFPGSDQLAKPFAHEFIYIPILGYFFMKSTHWEDFPLLLFFKAPSMCSSCPFWVDILTNFCIPNQWSINQALAFVFFL